MRSAASATNSSRLPPPSGRYTTTRLPRLPNSRERARADSGRSRSRSSGAACAAASPSTRSSLAIRSSNPRSSASDRRVRPVPGRNKRSSSEVSDRRFRPGARRVAPRPSAPSADASDRANSHSGNRPIRIRFPRKRSASTHARYHSAAGRDPPPSDEPISCVVPTAPPRPTTAPASSCCAGCNSRI